MPECAVCGQPRAEWAAHRCSYCGGTYCVEHRLPEQHVCRPSRRFRAKQGLRAALPSGRQVAALVGAIAIVAVVAVALSVGVSVPAVDSGVSTSDDEPTPDAVEAAFVDRYNDWRAAQGLNEVRGNDELAAMGQAHAKNMAQHDYIGHEQPDGTTIRDRYRSRGLLEACRLPASDGGVYPGAENAAGAALGDVQHTGSDEIFHVETADDLARFLLDSWVSSPGHRRVLALPAADEIGLGVAIRADGEVFAALEFC